MENLAAAHVLKWGPPPAAVSEIGMKACELGADFAPGWIPKFCKGIKHAAEALSDPDIPMPAKTEIIREIRIERELVKYEPVEVPVPTPTAPSPPAPSATSVINWAGMVQSMMAQFAVQVVMSMLFGGDDDEDNGLADCLHELRLFMVAIAQAIQQLREEMHARFDCIDKKLAAIHADVTYFGNALARQLSCMETLVIGIPLNQIGCKIDIVTQKLSCLEDLCGDLSHGVALRDVHTTMLDVQLLTARFGPDAVPTKDQLSKWLVTIENALMQPSAALKWLSMSYFLGQAHTAEIDAAHFKGVSFHDAIGWMTDKALLPYLMFVEIIKTYHTLRMLARAILPTYDVGNVCVRRIIAGCDDVEVTAIDIAAKVEAVKAEIQKLSTEFTFVKRQLSQRDEDDASNWRRRLSARTKEMVDFIPELDPRVYLYMNCNYSEVQWYAQQLRHNYQREFAEQVCKDEYPVIVRPRSAPVFITKKPFLMKGQNKVVIVSALGPLVRADQLGWGQLDLHLDIVAQEPYGLFSLNNGILSSFVWSCELDPNELLSRVVPWSLQIQAVWTGSDGVSVKAAEFAVASDALYLGSVCSSQKSIAHFRHSNEDYVTFDGTCTTAYLEHVVFSADVVSVSNVNAALSASIQQKLDDREALRQRESENTLKLDMSEARALLRWLIIMGYPESMMAACEKQDFASVLRSLESSPAAAPQSAPYAHFARSLLCDL